jgi:predicted phosphohydrolase
MLKENSQLLWATDLHLNFLKQIKSYNKQSVVEFAKYISIEHPNANAWILTGDISDGLNIIDQLNYLSIGFQKPIYFVLGNHDFFHSSFNKINNEIRQLCKSNSNLINLNNKIIDYNKDIVIIGTDGWYDARIGNTNSRVDLNDFYIIEELFPGKNYRDLLISIIRNKCDDYNNQLKLTLAKAYNTNKSTIIIATHVAPYVESAIYNGQPSDREWAPWFVNVNLGLFLEDEADNHPNINFVVLCGHSHSAMIYNHRNNLTVYTGPAKYGYPDIAGYIENNNIIAYNCKNQLVSNPLRNIHL